MAKFYGNDIGDASRAEERMLDRSLQLGLSNRDFINKNRQYEDQLTQQEYSNAAQNYFRQAALDEQAQSGDENRADKAASLAENQYQFDQGLTNAEAERQNRRDINDSNMKARLGLVQGKQDEQHANLILNRIAKGQIQNLEQLRDSDAGRSTPDQWNQFMNQLYNVQRAEHDAELDPIQKAKDANSQLLANDSFSSATDDASKKAAFWGIYNNLNKNRQYAGKLIPDDKNLQFLPATYKKKNPYTDAIEFFNKSKGPTKDSDNPDAGWEDPSANEGDAYPAWVADEKPSTPTPERESISKFVNPPPEESPAPPSSRYDNIDIMRNLGGVVSQGKRPAIYYTRVNDLIAGGATPAQAKAKANIEFGF